ncbi:ABC transporter permease [Silvibacterium sp.]|uniref:ABC transporter permease n=1 Tax=Silvibacterium sp. TaxID=1964179 RepID=UPI0039E556F4
MVSDLKLAWRQLRKSPGFAITAILTLALAIGANAIVFSVLNALVLRPLNVPHSENLFMVERGTGANTSPSQSYPDYRDLRDRNRSFDQLVSYSIPGGIGLDTGSGSPLVVWPYMVSGNYFDALGVQPYLGRFIHASEEHGKNSVQEIVLSYALWHSYFHGDPGILGRTVQLNKHPFTIVGVAAQSFRGTELFFAPDIWAPLVDQPEIGDWDPLENRGDHYAWTIGHLRPGVTAEAGAADLNTIAASLAKEHPKEDDGLKLALSHPGLVGNTLGQPTRAFMSGLMLLAGLILLAACANLGSLFAARAADRSREIAVRMALGSRVQLILRQLLTEAVVISLIGGAVGMVGAVTLLRLLSTWRPIPNIPINVPVNPDAMTYALAIGLAIFSGLLFGIVPVRQVLRSDPWQVIRSGGATTSGGRRLTVRDVLLGLQIAICAVLVTSSLVAVRGLARSLESSYGIQPANVMLAKVDLKMAGYERDQWVPMQKKMIEAAAAIPGVTAVGIADRLPLSIGGSDSDVFYDSTTDYRRTNTATDAQQFNVSPDYFRAAGTTLLAGRMLTVNDVDPNPLVAVINRQFAVKIFGSVQKAVGSHFKVWGGERVLVVGVVENGKYETLTEDQKTAMFFSFQQQRGSDTWLIVHSRREPQETAAALSRVLRGLDPTLPFDIHTWNSELDSALFAARVATVALGVMGILGTMLAITGIFGMASYTVSKRLRELGIRIALGANQRKVLAAALGRSFRLLAIGSLAGLVLGVMAARVLSSIVYQATPRDPLILAGVLVTMLAIGLVATWLPARRALAVDPMMLLREQ